MIAAPLILCVAFVTQSDDPVGGNPLYVARLGEKGIVHYYDLFNPENRSDPEKIYYTGFIDTGALIDYETARLALLDKHKGEMFYRPSADEFRNLKQPFISKGQAVELAHKTSVEILGYGDFSRVMDRNRPKENTFHTPIITQYYVRILDGKYKGKHVWIDWSGVRIPDSKPFEKIESQIGDNPMDEAEDEGFGRKLTPTEDKDEASPQKITLIDTDWELDGNFTKVYARVKNTMDRKIKFLKATATFEDSGNKLVRTEHAYATPHTLAPGDIATIEISTKADPRFDHYGLKFEADDKDIPYNRPNRR